MPRDPRTAIEVPMNPWRGLKTNDFLMAWIQVEEEKICYENVELDDMKIQISLYKHIHKSSMYTVITRRLW